VVAIISKRNRLMEDKKERAVGRRKSRRHRPSKK
jgi:hypothetical protein